MNYCIIMPRSARNDQASYAFPIGMAYVSAALKATGRTVITYNLNYKHEELREILSELIQKYNIDVIASGGLTTQYSELFELFKTVKQIKPDIITWVGGGIITASPIPAMEALMYADYGMIGEGEITICELAEAMEGKRTLDSVDGLIYRDPEKSIRWKITSPRKEITDLDALPFPDYDGFEYEELLNKANFELNAEHSGMVAFSRSCPFNCTFCFHPSGTKYRKRSLANILQETDYLIQRYHIKSLYISDELFALRREDFENFCSAMRSRGLTYMIALRVDMVSEKMIQELKDSGCRLVAFGLESADNRILESMNKHTTVEQIENALELCRRANLPTQGNFIFGDEAETVESYHNTLRWWREHPQYNIKLGYISVYPGSILYQNACKKGLIKDEVEYIRQGCPQINVSRMTNEEYRKMMLEISVAFNKGTEILGNGNTSYAKTGLVNIQGNCPHCGAYNMWENREAFRPVTKLVCNNCKKLVDIYPLDYINTTTYLNNFQKIGAYRVGLWGVVSSLEALFEYMPDAWKENFQLIDSSPQKQGIELYGKIIQSPEIINQEHLDMIIITFTSTAAGSIYRTILESYPSVKKILYLGDFLNPDLDI